MKLLTIAALAVSVMAFTPAGAGDITIRVKAIDARGVGKDIGWIRAVDTDKGLRMIPRLSEIGPGAHGFHVHQNPSCGNKGAGGKMGAGLAAGGHFDPGHASHHKGPHGEGHLGDMPTLVADANGVAQKPVLAPRLKVADLYGRSIMIHAAGDNYSDSPKKLGGGGGRIACGVIPARKMKDKMHGHGKKM